MNTLLEHAKSQFDLVTDEKVRTLVREMLSIANEMHLDTQTRVAGLLYYPYTLGLVDEEKIETEYSQEIFTIVKSLDKLEQLNYSQQKIEAENLRKMFFAITKDIQVIMLKLAFVIARMRHLYDKTDDEQLAFCNAVMDLYAPLSARLGLSSYKTELEDKAFLRLKPHEYNDIITQVGERYVEREAKVNKLIDLVKECMAELDIKGRVSGRKKHIYSIYKKLIAHKTLDKIYDLIAVRAIVNSVAECYALLGKIHSVVTPLQNRFKDYIAIPKSNGYQSLHTTVMFDGVPVEVQIRTAEMHKYAEFGVAAHWLYKEKRTTQSSLDTKLGWVREMLDSKSTPEDLASSLKVDIYDGEIFVQTPKGKVIHLPAGSTPIDFAYHIHSDIGHKCVGAKVNGKMVPTTTHLNNGDIVEIVTNPNSKGPSRDWLKFVKTGAARNSINNFFKRTMKEENIKLGHTMLEQAVREKGYQPSKVITPEYLKTAMEKYNITVEEEFYATLGANAIPIRSVANRLVQLYLKDIKQEQNLLEQNQMANIRLNEPSEKLIDIKGLNNILLKFAGCCHPMPGDAIIGFVSTGRGVIIHRAICPNVACFDTSRLIEASWKTLSPKPTTKKSGKNKTKKDAD